MLLLEQNTTRKGRVCDNDVQEQRYSIAKEGYDKNTLHSSAGDDGISSNLANCRKRLDEEEIQAAAGM